MIGGRALRPDELGDIDVRDLPDAMAAARELEGALDDLPVRPSAGFVDRVMTSLADEPSPAPAGFLVPLRRRGLVAGFAASVRQAWASLGAGRPALARSAALAYVLVVAIAGASLAGVATLGAAGALGILGPDATESPPPTTPEPSPAPTIPPPIATPFPLPTVAPSPVAPTPSPSETPDESDDNGGNSGPRGGGDDDVSGNSGPGSSDDSGGNSGPGGGGDDSARDDESGDDRSRARSGSG